MLEASARLNCVNVWCPRCGSVVASPMYYTQGTWACVNCGRRWDIVCVFDPQGEVSQGKEDVTQNSFGREVQA